MSQSRRHGHQAPQAPRVLPSLPMVTMTASATQLQAPGPSGGCPPTTPPSPCIPVRDNSNHWLLYLHSPLLRCVSCVSDPGWCNNDTLPRNPPLPALAHAILCCASREFYWTLQGGYSELRIRIQSGPCEIFTSLTYIWYSAAK